MFIGNLALVLRYALIAGGGALAGAGIGGINPELTTITIEVEPAVQALTGLGSILLAAAWRKVAVRKGGKT